MAIVRAKVYQTCAFMTKDIYDGRSTVTDKGDNMTCYGSLDIVLDSTMFLKKRKKNQFFPSKMQSKKIMYVIQGG